MAPGLRVPARAAGLIAVLLLAAGCGEEADDTPALDFPTVVAAEATQAADGTWRFDVTLSSPYDTPEHYADAWRVRDQSGSRIYGVRELAHHHANEQPFTRSLSGVEIPDGVTVVWIEGRDSENGWGPSFELVLD